LQLQLYNLHKGILRRKTVIREWLRALIWGVVGLVASSAAAQNVGGNQSFLPCECAPSPRPCTVTEGIWYMKPNGHFDPAKQEKNLSKLLKLTAEQQSQVLDVLKSARAQLEAMRSDPSLSSSVRKCRVALVREASNDQIRELLDKKQDAKLMYMQTPHTFSLVGDYPSTTQ